MEYIIATILLTFLALVLLSKNYPSNRHSNSSETRVFFERVEARLHQIQYRDRARQADHITRETQAQLTRIEQKLDLIIQEFDIKNNRPEYRDPLQLQTEIDVILHFPESENFYH